MAARRIGAPIPSTTGTPSSLISQSERSQQIDLFDGVTPTQTPAWRDLPEETRRTLTGLMARLILEHAQISSLALRTEAGHDH
jgi:hypothetical protein